jgi:hypothetical protein
MIGFFFCAVVRKFWLALSLVFLKFYEYFQNGLNVLKTEIIFSSV